MGQKMESAFKMHPNGADSNGGGGVSIHVGLKANPTGDSSPSASPHIKSSATTSLLSTLQRHRKNKIESSAGKQLKVAEEKRVKRSSSSSFKTFFNKIGSRGMLLYGSRQEVVPTSTAMMANDPKQPLFNKNEKDPSTSPPLPISLTAKKPQVYHRHSLSSHSRSEFFTYIKCDDPTDGLSWDRKESLERGQENNSVITETPEEDQREVKKSSSLKRSHFPYSFLRSKLGTLPEDDKHQLIPNESTSSTANRNTLDVSRQNSITSLDYHHHPQQRNPPARQLSTVQRLSRHLSSSNAESGYDSDSGRNVDSGGELAPKWSPGGTSCDDEPQQQDVTRRASRQLIIRQLTETEDVGIVTRLKLLPNSTARQIPVVTGMMENGAAFRCVGWPGVLFLILFIIAVLCHLGRD